jgi:hypothetical protein
VSQALAVLPLSRKVLACIALTFTLVMVVFIGLATFSGSTRVGIPGVATVTVGTEKAKAALGCTNTYQMKYTVAVSSSSNLGSSGSSMGYAYFGWPVYGPSGGVWSYSTAIYRAGYSYLGWIPNNSRTFIRQRC